MNMHNLAAQHAQSDWNIPDPGNGKPINVERSGVCVLKGGASAQTRTLPGPKAIGQRIFLARQDNGAGAIAVTCKGRVRKTGLETTGAIGVNGATTLSFAAYQVCELVAVHRGENLQWAILAMDSGTQGPTLS